MRGPTCADAMYDEVWKWCQWLEPTQDHNHDYKDHPKGKMPVCKKLFHGPVTGQPGGKGRDQMFVWDCQKGDAEPTCKDCWTIDSVPRYSEQWFKQYSTKTESEEAYNSRAEWHSRCGSYLRFESENENSCGKPSLEYSEGCGHIRLGGATCEASKKAISTTAQTVPWTCIRSTKKSQSPQNTKERASQYSHRTAKEISQ